MKSSHVLEAADVKAVGLAAETEAHKNGWPVSIAVVDAGGYLLSLQRLDGAAPATVQMASAKANTAALVQRDSKHFEDMINGGRVAFLSAPELRGVLEGGVVIVKNGHCIGAVGVSGVKPSEDAQVARAGIAALGL